MSTWQKARAITPPASQWLICLMATIGVDVRTAGAAPPNLPRARLTFADIPPDMGVAWLAPERACLVPFLQACLSPSRCHSSTVPHHTNNSGSRQHDEAGGGSRSKSEGRESERKSGRSHLRSGLPASLAAVSASARPSCPLPPSSYLVGATRGWRGGGASSSASGGRAAT